MSARLFLNIVYTLHTQYMSEKEHEEFDAELESELHPRNLQPVAGETVIVS